jgi:hypothetical protein
VCWWAARPTLAAAAIYAVLSLLMVAPGLVPGHTLSSSDSLWSNVPWFADRPADVPGLGSNFELADSVQVFQPFLRYTRGQLPDLPLWNPFVAGGRPYLANAQSAIFSPFSWPSFVLPFWSSLAVVAALKLFLGALGGFALGRILGMRFGGALVAGLVFAFGQFFVVWLSWPLTNIFPLVPWMLVLCELLARRAAVLPAAGLAGLIALAYFGGHPETTFHALVVTVLFFGFRLLLHARATRAGPRVLVRPVAAFVLAGVSGTAIAAVMLVPFAELLFHSGDLARRAHEQEGFWPRKYLGALFLHDYWGRPTQQSNIEPFMQVRGWYAGAVTLMLAVAALLRPSLERVVIAVFAVLVALVVVGVDPVFVLVTKLPGFSTAHNERMLIYILLALALLAGWGLDELMRHAPTMRWRRGVLVAGGVIFLVPFAWMAVAGTLTTRGLRTALEVAWGFSHPPPVLGFGGAPNPGAADIVRMSALLQWIPLAGLGLALIALRLRRTRPLPVAVFVALVGLLLAADLFRANMGFNPSIPKRNAVMPETGAIRYLRSRRPNRFVGVSLQMAFQPLPADMAMDFGLYDARSYDYPAEQRYDALWRRNVAPGVPDFAQPVQLASGTPASVRALSLLSVSDLLLHPRGRLKGAGLSVAYRGPDGIVYRNAGALPRVFLVDRQRTVSGGRAALVAATAPGFDRRHVAITERRVPGLPQATGRGGTTPGTARLASYGTERVVAESASRSRSLLVLTDVAFPGWTARVDGRKVPIERVDSLVRGVALPAGRHRIEFSYAPASFRAGWIIGLLGLLAVLGAAAVGLRARRDQSDAGRPSR